MKLKVQLKQCSQCWRTNRVQRQRYWRLNSKRGKEGRKEGAQKVLSTHNTQGQRGVTASNFLPGPFYNIAGFPLCLCDSKKLGVGELNSEPGTWREPRLGKCSFYVGHYASLQVTSQLPSLQSCYRGVLILTLDLWTLRPWWELFHPKGQRQCSLVCWSLQPPTLFPVHTSASCSRLNNEGFLSRSFLL